MSFFDDNNNDGNSSSDDSENFNTQFFGNENNNNEIKDQLNSYEDCGDDDDDHGQFWSQCNDMSDDRESMVNNDHDSFIPQEEAYYTQLPIQSFEEGKRSNVAVAPIHHNSQTSLLSPQPRPAAAYPNPITKKLPTYEFRRVRDFPKIGSMLNRGSDHMRSTSNFNLSRETKNKPDSSIDNTSTKSHQAHDRALNIRDRFQSRCADIKNRTVSSDSSALKPFAHKVTTIKRKSATNDRSNYPSSSNTSSDIHTFITRSSNTGTKERNLTKKETISSKHHSNIMEASKDNDIGANQVEHTKTPCPETNNDLQYNETSHPDPTLQTDNDDTFTNDTANMDNRCVEVKNSDTEQSVQSTNHNTDSIDNTNVNCTLVSDISIDDIIGECATMNNKVTELYQTLEELRKKRSQLFKTIATKSVHFNDINMRLIELDPLGEKANHIVKIVDDVNSLSLLVNLTITNQNSSYKEYEHNNARNY